MSLNNILAAKSGITNIESRPNVILTYTGANASETDDIAKLLMREEINVYTTDCGDKKLRELCPNGSWHMMIVRDGGLAAPSFDIIGNLRKISDIPLLTVSDSCDEIYRTMALAKGADACMDADDFGKYEFKARVISMLRRYLGESAESRSFLAAGGTDTLVNGAISVDRRRREVFSDGNPVKLTAIEYGIVEYLMENCGDVCTVDDIYRRVWRENPYSVRKTVVEHIRRIRSKIEPDPHNPSYIKVVFGVGYKMERAAV